MPGQARPAAQQQQQPMMVPMVPQPAGGILLGAVPQPALPQQMVPAQLTPITVDNRAGHGLLIPAQQAQQAQHLQQQQYQQELQMQQQQAQLAQLKQEKLAKQRSRALDDEELGSDDDDDLDLDLGDDDPVAKAPKNSLICLFEKISRVKNKRRVQLRDGLMKVNGREYIFARANGEFDW